MFTVQEIEQLYGSKLRAFRRLLHENPELSQQEHKTTALIRSLMVQARQLLSI